MRILTLIAVSAAAMSLTAPAFAQDAMANGAMGSAPMKMTPKEMKKMDSCKAMSHDMMMKNAGCMKLMKMHPDMMSGDNMMSGH
jgi:hypothetical protein